MGEENSSHNNASMGSAGGSQNNEPSKLHFHSIVNDHHLYLVEEPPNVSVELTETDSMSEKMNGTSSGENICWAAQKEITHSNTLDGNFPLKSDVEAVLGVKRARLTDDDQQASVHIRYKFLSRESKKKLEQLLHHWSEWHAQHGSSTKDSNEILESGNETFFPALNVGPEKSSTMSFLMDDQVTKKQTMGTLSGDSVPLYDREFAFALTSSDGSTSDERVLESLNASRCFNCSSYNHSLKECPKPRDNAAVNNARKQFHSNKKQTVGPRVPSRYYQNSPRGKFDGLKPGSLDAETRKLLGLGELDPPPWLNRMREMGYPPGYLDVEDEEQPSGITIFDDEETKEKNEEIFKVDISEPQKKMSICFPGINAPIPENADQSCWAAPQSTPSSSNNQSNNRSNYSPELTPRGHSYYQRLSSGSSNGHFSGYANELNSFLSGYSHSNVELGPTPTYSSEFINPYSYPPFPLPPPWHST